jgi:2,4-dienoyl-CoA reductase-like NADH-dependent reductase (Old Yellow Enzyme family)
MAYSHLLKPLRIKHVSLRNRVVMPPMVSNMLRDGVSEQALGWYAERAKGGVGLVIVEAVWVERFRDEAFVRQLRALAEKIHAHGAAAAIQLFKRPIVAGKPVSISGEGGNRQITTEEVAAIPGEYAAAAKAAKEAGFDGAEIHGAHGFFLNQFFSPRTNRRTDTYGGSLEGRSRLGLESASAVRKAVGEGFLLFYRHTPEQGVAGGYSLADSVAFCKKLEEAGVDVIDISPSRREGGPHAALAAAIKKAVGVPVIAVGGMNDPVAAEAALSKKCCDLCAIGRGLIADAHWVEKVRARKEDDIIRCIECNEGCFGRLRSGVPIGCTQNPESGNEYLHR